MPVCYQVYTRVTMSWACREYQLTSTKLCCGIGLPYLKALLLQCSAAWQMMLVMHALTAQQTPAWLQPHLQPSSSSSPQATLFVLLEGVLSDLISWKQSKNVTELK